MKKYRLVYWNDFQDEYLATPIGDDDGDWYGADDVDAALAAKDREISSLVAALEGLRRSHTACDDNWYSCPLSDEGCANESETDCNCGAQEHNAKIEAMLAAMKERT